MPHPSRSSSAVIMLWMKDARELVKIIKGTSTKDEKYRQSLAEEIEDQFPGGPGGTK
jgi:hypothetical protein